MKKIKPITKDQFLTFFSNESANNGKDYKEYFQETIDNIKNFAPGPFFWYISNHFKLAVENISDSVSQLSPYTKEQWMGRSIDILSELLHPDDMYFMLSAMQFSGNTILNLAPSERRFVVFNIFGRMLDRNNQYRWIMFQLPNEFINEENKIERTLCVVYDLSHFQINNMPLLTIVDSRNKEAQYYKSFERQITRIDTDIPSITKREKEILHLMAQGFNTPEITQKLFISYHTVENHKRNLRKKTGVKTSGELIAYAVKFNLIFI